MSLRDFLQVGNTAPHQRVDGGSTYTLPALSFHLDEDHPGRPSTTPKHITIHVDVHVHRRGASSPQSRVAQSEAPVVPRSLSSDDGVNPEPSHQHDHLWLNFGEHFPNWTTHSFDYTRSFGWSHFAQSIQDWFVALNAQDDTEEYRWGLDAFWIAYTSAYPSFPSGSWPEWDSRIPVSGNFIKSYLKQALAPSANGVGEAIPSRPTSTPRLLAEHWTLMEGLISELSVGCCL